MQTIQGVYNELSSPKKIVITTHQKPDGDALGSMLGLHNWLVALGHSVTPISPTNWANFLNWMPGVSHVVDFELSKDIAKNYIAEADILFCLDFNILYRTKNMEPFLADFKGVRVLIDHHEQPQVDYFTYGISNTAKSSTAEMVYDFIVESAHADKIDTNIAQCLYAGVMTDTGSFRFRSTSANVHLMVAKLKETGFDHTLVHDNIYDSFLENRVRFIGHALLNRMEIMYESNTALLAITKQDLLRFHMKTGDTEGLVNHLLTIQGMRLAALCIDRDEERKWSFRSKGDFDVNTFARQHFEGGGHFNAAGGRSSDTLDATVWKFKTVMKQYREQLQ